MSVVFSSGVGRLGVGRLGGRSAALEFSFALGLCAALGGCAKFHPAPPMTSPSFLEEASIHGSLDRAEVVSDSDDSRDASDARAEDHDAARFSLAKVDAPATIDVVAEAGPALPPITFRDPMPAALGASSPAVTYAQLGPVACKKEAAKRGLPLAPSKSPQRGIETAERFDGDLNGVHLAMPPASSKFGVLDCRLALVIDDWTRALHQAGVTRITIDNTYRPNAKLPGKKKSSQHAFGLAIDVTSFTFSDGRVLTTANWGAAIGEVPCGPDAVMASPTAQSIQVRNFVCSMARGGFFNTVLTPSFNAAHQSHFHLDIKEDTTRATVR